MAIELDYDTALSYVNDNLKAVSDPEVQKELHEKWKAEEDPKKRPAARQAVLLPRQLKVASKYGFEETQKSLALVAAAFGPWNHTPEIHALNTKVMYWIDPDTQDKFGSVEDYMKTVPIPQPAPNAKSRPFTLKMAQDMQAALIAGYSEPDFQATLKKQLQDAAGDQKKIATVKKELFFTVQTKILPTYGFEASAKGVQASLAAYGPYNTTDPLVIEQNLTMAYWTTPESQSVSLEEYLKKAKEAVSAAKEPAAKAAAKEKALPKAPAAPQAKPQAKPQVKPGGKSGASIGSAKLAMLQKMKTYGGQGATLQRLDAQGQAAGWAPLEFVEEANDVYEHGKNLTEAGKFEEGEPYLRDAYQLFEEICGEGHLYTMACANTLGFNLHEQGRFSEGEPILKVAVDGFTRCCGKRDPQTVAAMNNYALCLQGIGKMGEAASILREILKLSEENTTRAATTSILSNLAETLRLDGQVREAEELFFKAYRIICKEHGPESLQGITLLNNLAVCLRDQRKNEGARQHYERALKGLKQYYGPEHPKVKLVEKNLEELKTDLKTEQVELAPHLQIEPRKEENQFYKATCAFQYQPMTSFSQNGIKAFSKVLIDPVTAARPRPVDMFVDK